MIYFHIITPLFRPFSLTSYLPPHRFYGVKRKSIKAQTKKLGYTTATVFNGSLGKDKLCNVALYHTVSQCHLPRRKSNSGKRDLTAGGMCLNPVRSELKTPVFHLI